MSVMKGMSIIKAFVLVIAAISVTSKSSASTPIDLGTWSVVQYDYISQDDANWVLSNGNTKVEQIVNADASIFLGNFDIAGRVIDGTWRVDTSTDDDFMGFVFGYQGRGQYYLFDWKQFSHKHFRTGDFGEKGMSIKIVNVLSGDPADSDLWSTAGSANVSVIRHNTIGWKDSTDYDFHLEFNSGFFVIEIRESGTVLQRWEVSDSTFTSGFFGFYNYSQENVVYKGFTEKICNYSLSPGSQSFTADAGTGVVGITVGPDACDWTAVSNDPWISITSASTGIGNGSINYSVSEKLTSGSRTGTMTIDGETFTVTQDGPPGITCDFTITPTNQVFTTSAAGTGSVSVTAVPGSCDWTAISSASWITVTSGSTGTGNGSVGYSVSENTSVVPRTATITIAEETFTVTQEGKIPPTCSYGITPTSQAFGSPSGSGSVSVSTSEGCDWTAISSASWITVTSGSTGTGDGTVSYSVSEKLSAGSRTGTMTIAGETITVTQEGSGACTFSITPASQTFTTAGGTDSVDVTAVPGSCSWTAISNASWITVTSGNAGTGNGNVSYSVSENASIVPRTATIDIAEQVYTVTQSGAISALFIKANGSDGPVTPTDNLSITVEIDPGINSGLNADWWVVANASGTSTIDGWYYFDLSAFGFVFAGASPDDFLPTVQVPLVRVLPFEIFSIPASSLPSGTYTFYFGFDTNMNGLIDFDKLVFDLVKVIKP